MYEISVRFLFNGDEQEAKELANRIAITTKKAMGLEMKYNEIENQDTIWLLGTSIQEVFTP